MGVRFQMAGDDPSPRTQDIKLNPVPSSGDCWCLLKSHFYGAAPLSTVDKSKRGIAGRHRQTPTPRFPDDPGLLLPHPIRTSAEA